MLLVSSTRYTCDDYSQNMMEVSIAFHHFCFQRRVILFNLDHENLPILPIVSDMTRYDDDVDHHEDDGQEEGGDP